MDPLLRNTIGAIGDTGNSFGANGRQRPQWTKALEFKVKARPFCDALMRKGLLAKETHETTARFAPPLIITQAEVDELFARFTRALGAVERAEAAA